MKNQFKCFMLLALAFITSSWLLALAFITSSWLLPTSAHPTAKGTSCDVVNVDQAISIVDVHQLAVVGGDVMHPPCYMASVFTKIDNGKSKGFDSAMLPGHYAELRIYSWYIPVTIGKPLTKSPGSIFWQSKLVLRSDYDKI